MWYFLSVLVLWATTFELARWEPWVLSPVTLWTWWTFSLYVVAAAATTGRFQSLTERLTGLFGFAMVVVYYRTMSDTYMKFIPTDETHPDMWPTIFLAVNLLGPLLLIVVGLVQTTVQRRGEG